MCDCFCPNSRFPTRESTIGRLRGDRRDAFVSVGCRNLLRRRTLETDNELSFASFRRHYKIGNQRSGLFHSETYRFLRRLNYARFKDDEGASNSADLRSATFPEPAGASGASNFDILQLKRELEEDEITEEFASKATAKKNLESSKDAEIADPESGQDSSRRSGRKRQMLRRSSLLAKQVISVRSARSLGFISQLWVDTISWTVLVVEVRPHLLSGEIERLLLEDIYQVGDVVLVQDENVTENEIKMNSLDTLVGYNVVTSARRKIGKVRGYNFNINSGAVESLELDSMGVSLIPASLVSTYSLMVEDVIQVLADTVVVDQDAESRLQRLTKGFLDNSTTEGLGSWEDDEEYSELRRQVDRSTRRRSSPSQGGADDYWDLPINF